ncbi:MAG: hypothetical protein F6K65_42665 [Moorea sp. SIO3C2]|nr:hypothetical protein [Moorena sp. SIO3C2]
MTATTVFTPCLVLSLRRQYHSCHIQLPDSNERVAAIAIHNEYYSLFQVIESPAQAIDMAIRLSTRGEAVAIRQLPVGGYALWVKETNARPTRSFSLIERRSTRHPKPASCYIFTARNQYQSVEITVPDLDQSLLAVQVQGHYYSLFKPQATAEQTLELTAKLAQRGDETVILALPEQAPHYSICVFEPDAMPR